MCSSPTVFSPFVGRLKVARGRFQVGPAAVVPRLIVVGGLGITFSSSRIFFFCLDLGRDEKLTYFP